MTEETVESPKETTLSDLLDAVKELTSTVSDLVTTVDGMREDMNLKKRAGVFDGAKIPKTT